MAEEQPTVSPAPRAGRPPPRWLVRAWMALEDLGVRLGGAILPLSPATLRRLVRFGTAGVASTGTYIGLAVLLVEGLATDETLAAAIAFPVSVLVSFFGQALAFNSTPQGVTFLRFLVITCGTWALSVGWMEAATQWGIHYGIALAVIVVAVPIANFIGYSLFVFADRSPDGGPPAKPHPPKDPPPKDEDVLP